MRSISFMPSADMAGDAGAARADTLLLREGKLWQ